MRWKRVAREMGDMVLNDPAMTHLTRARRNPVRDHIRHSSTDFVGNLANGVEWRLGDAEEETKGLSKVIEGTHEDGKSPVFKSGFITAEKREGQCRVKTIISQRSRYRMLMGVKPANIDTANTGARGLFFAGISPVAVKPESRMGVRSAALWYRSRQEFRAAHNKTVVKHVLCVANMSDRFGELGPVKPLSSSEMTFDPA
ncbi:hypothetical protein CPB85DRAFT_1458665 [Mucidula mucida]|nr:hypothetical protein CPB85DRAFT_1458665 [Mucidula mucida]